MQELVRMYVVTCDKCQLFKESKVIPFGHLTERVFHKKEHCWQLDTIGPFLADRMNKKYIIVLVDVFSSFLVARAVKDIKTPTIIRFLSDTLRKFKIEYLRTDLHRVFTSEKFQRYANSKNIKLIKSLSYTPQCNGKVECLNKILKNRLAIRSVGYLDQWSQFVQEMVHSINITPEEVSKVAPYQIMFDEMPFISDEDKYPIFNENLKLSDQEIKVQNEKIVRARHMHFYVTKSILINIIRNVSSKKVIWLKYCIKHIK
jgi:hypothetical protein